MSHNIYIFNFFIITFMWYKVYSCNLLLPSLRNLENRLEIKLIVFVLLANSDTYQRKKIWSNSRRWRNIGESPNRCCYHAGRGVLTLKLIGGNVQNSIIGKPLKNSKPIYFVLCESFVLCVRSGLINPLRHQHVITTRLHFCVSTYGNFTY